MSGSQPLVVPLICLGSGVDSGIPAGCSGHRRAGGGRRANGGHRRWQYAGEASLVQEQRNVADPHPPDRKRALHEDSRRPGKWSNLFPVAKPKRWAGVETGLEQLPQLGARAGVERPQSFPEPGGRHIKHHVRRGRSLVPARSPDMKPKRYSVPGQEGQVYMRRASESGEGGLYPDFHLSSIGAPCSPNLSVLVGWQPKRQEARQSPGVAAGSRYPKISRRKAIRSLRDVW